MLTLIAFAGVLWSITPSLLAAAIGYALLGSVGTVLLGRRLVSLDNQQLRKEADFRYGLVRVRDRAETGGPIEDGDHDRLGERLAAVVANFRAIIAVNLRLNFFTGGYNYLTQIIPAAVVAPLYIRGEVEFGTVTQAAMAFSQVLGAFSLLVSQFQNLSSYAAVANRLGELWEATEPATCLHGALAAPLESKSGDRQETTAAGSDPRLRSRPACTGADQLWLDGWRGPLDDSNQQGRLWHARRLRGLQSQAEAVVAHMRGGTRADQRLPAPGHRLQGPRRRLLLLVASLCRFQELACFLRQRLDKGLLLGDAQTHQRIADPGLEGLSQGAFQLGLALGIQAKRVPVLPVKLAWRHDAATPARLDDNLFSGGAAAEFGQQREGGLGLRRCTRDGQQPCPGPAVRHTVDATAAERVPLAGLSVEVDPAARYGTNADAIPDGRASLLELAEPATVGHAQNGAPLAKARHAPSGPIIGGIRRPGKDEESVRVRARRPVRDGMDPFRRGRRPGSSLPAMCRGGP